MGAPTNVIVDVVPGPGFGVLWRPVCGFRYDGCEKSVRAIHVGASEWARAGADLGASLGG